jgi:sulfite exporter TauE/SafE
LELSFPVAFVIGLFSAAHCLGMCGSIAGALALSLPSEIRGDPKRLGAYVVVYNLGRVASYTSAGALVGLVGSQITNLEFLQGGHEIARVATALVVIVVGLYLTGWVPQLRQMDRLGDPVWRRLQPLSRRLLPVRSLSRAALFGLIWGWLPCGLVYYVLLLTVSADGALEGALLMLSFGLGTLPGVIGVGLVTGWFTRLARNAILRQVVGLSLVALGIFALVQGAQWIP